MSEYQYIAFRATDRPLTDQEFDFAQTQSSRAEITRRSFTNEYHFGDFRGDPEKLLRRGFDAHLHYANYGVRTVMMRLPLGLPFPKLLWSKYVDGERITWKKDKKGNGGILIISPFNEGGDLDEIWELDPYVDDISQVRNELIGGDLRALYVVWLCGSQDGYADPSDLIEPPIPAGIGQASAACQGLLEFYDIDPLTLIAAGEGALPCPDIADANDVTKKWIAGLRAGEARKLLSQFLTGDAATAKADVMQRIRAEADHAAWPTTSDRRTLEQLRQRTEQLRDAENARERAKQQAAATREAKRKERERLARMKQMVDQPQRWLKEADELVAQRGTDNYKEAAEILADLEEAIGGEEGKQMVRRHAAHLAKSYPTLNRLKSSLRQRGLLS